MRPSFTTLAGMTIAAGSIAIVGASIVGTGTASARTEPVYPASITQPEVAPIDLGPLVSVGFTQQITEPAALEPAEVGTDAEIGFVNEPGDDYSWIDGDSCPPCGMG